jgi:hypothetical protein
MGAFLFSLGMLSAFVIPETHVRVGVAPPPVFPQCRGTTPALTFEAP